MFFSVFWLFGLFSLVLTSLRTGEEVNIYELYGDSMCQFALLLMNK